MLAVKGGQWQNENRIRSRYSLWNVFEHPSKVGFSCLPIMYYIRRQQSLLQRALFIKPNIFQAFWDVEALLQLLISAVIVQNSHRQCVNKYSWLCPQNINLKKLVGDNIWPASHSLLAPDLYYFIYVIYVYLLNYLYAQCSGLAREKNVISLVLGAINLIWKMGKCHNVLYQIQAKISRSLWERPLVEGMVIWERIWTDTWTDYKRRL